MLNAVMVSLNELKERNVKYKEMIIMLEENKIRVGLEYTFYDYEDVSVLNIRFMIMKNYSQRNYWIFYKNILTIGIIAWKFIFMNNRNKIYIMSNFKN